MIYEKNKDLFKIMIDNNIKMKVKPITEQKEFIRPENDYDFHAYRILLLIYICGKEIIHITNYPVLFGRNKFAFYDFLIRYPSYLKRTIEIKNKLTLMGELNLKLYEEEKVLLPMIKYLRGPWDQRYDNFFNYMKSKGLIELKIENVTPKGKKKIFCLTLTKLGNNIAEEISELDKEWTNRMQIINQLFVKSTTNETINKFIESNFNELIIGRDIYDY
jgi:hypothetical protein